MERNKWLAKTWKELYIEYPNDNYLRKLTTDELVKTDWFKKYNIIEPKF